VAAATYRTEYRPSEQNPEPYLIVAANLIAAESRDEADVQFQASLRWRARRFLAPGKEISDADLDALLELPGGEQVRDMMRYSAVGTPDQVHAYLADLAARTHADEMILSPAATRRADRIRAVELITAPVPASVSEPAPTPTPTHSA
jgi:putative transposase